MTWLAERAIAPAGIRPDSLCRLTREQRERLESPEFYEVLQRENLAPLHAPIIPTGLILAHLPGRSENYLATDPRARALSARILARIFLHGHLLAIGVLLVRY